MEDKLIHIRELGELVFSSIEQESYYSCYVIMRERTAALFALSSDEKLPQDQLLDIKIQTSAIEQSLHEKMAYIHQALDREVHSAQARTLYAKQSIT